MKKLISLISLAALLLPVASSAYTVQKGDTLWGLYGSNWKTVAAKNGITDPAKLQIGQVINDGGILGATPLPVDNYDTFLTFPLGSSASTTFVNALPNVSSSVYTIFGSDGVTPREKIYCSGTQASPKALTGCIRGLSFSPLNGVIDETAGTGLTHSKNARIAVTDNINFTGKALAMLYGFMTSSLKSTDANPFIFVNHPQGPAANATNPLEYITLGQLTSVTSTGCANASETVRGCVEEATPFEAFGSVNATSTGATGARLFVSPDVLYPSMKQNIITARAFGTINAGDVVKASTNQVVTALATSVTDVNSIVGIALDTGTSIDIRVALPGSIVSSTIGTVPNNSILYLSNTGQVSATPGTIRKVVGFYVSSTAFLFNPSIQTPTSSPGQTYTPVMTSASGTLPTNLIATSTGDGLNGNYLRSTSTGPYWGPLNSAGGASTTASRIIGNVYRNTSTVHNGRTLMVGLTLNPSGSSATNGQCSVQMDDSSSPSTLYGSVYLNNDGGAGVSNSGFFFMPLFVPPNWYWKVTNVANCAIYNVYEMEL